MNSTFEEDKRKVKIPGWAFLLTMTVVILLIIAALYINIFRYYLVGYSIDHNNLATSAMLLSPEIAWGLATII
jgi:hypothetical protein